MLKAKQKTLYANCILNPLQVSLIGLEKALQQYLALEQQDTAFDLRTVPIATQPVERRVFTNGALGGDQGHQAGGQGHGHGPSKKGAEKMSSIASRQDIFAQQLEAVPAIQELAPGPLLKSSLPVELTESETEYVVTAVKHVFARHVVFQFDLANTLNDQVLEHVKVTFQVLFEVVAIDKSMLIVIFFLFFSRRKATAKC